MDALNEFIKNHGWAEEKETIPYLNKHDSELYMTVDGSDDERDIIIKNLLIDKAKASRNAHCQQSR